MNKKEILILGDSIVCGAFDFFMGGWTRRLASYFKKENSSFKVYSNGVIGNDTRKLINNFEKEIKNRKSYIIIFSIGINDTQIVANQTRISIDEFKNNITTLCEKAKKVSSKIVFVGLNRINDIKAKSVWWNSKKTYKNEIIEKYDLILKAILGEKRIEYIEISDIFEDKTLLYDDIHPNARGHQKIFERVKKKLIQII
jgi:lysophospholipase L1-like esterase